MEYKTLESKIVLDEFLKVEKAKVSFSSFQENQPDIVAERYTVRRPKVIAVLLEREETGNIILVEQFRYASVKHNKAGGWTQEIVAGIVDRGEDPLTCAYRETEEETGYKVKELKQIGGFYPSFGFSDEFIFLYAGKVCKEDKKSQGGGLIEETENIRVIEYPLAEIADKLQNGYFQDGKTMIALQWKVLQKCKQTMLI